MARDCCVEGLMIAAPYMCIALGGTILPAHQCFHNMDMRPEQLWLARELAG